MKRSYLLIIGLFAVSAVLFAVTQVRERMKTSGEAPVITMDRDSLEVSVNVTDEELLAGVTATDAEDGDLTDQLLVESYSRFLSKGRRTVTIGVADSQGKITEAERTITYTDYRSPVFNLTAPLYLSIDNCDDPVSLLTASDVMDGDISNKIQISSIASDYGEKTGDFPIEFKVSNSAGDTETLTTKVTLYDAKEMYGAPEIQLDRYMMYVKEGDSFSPWTYVTEATLEHVHYVREGSQLEAEDGNEDEDGDVLTLSSSDFSISNDVNTNEPGTYEVLYRLEDEDGKLGSTRLLVVVR